MEYRLWLSPAAGDDSVTQCTTFNLAMWSKIGRNPDGAYLSTFVEGNRRGVAVEFDPTVPGAQDWAADAREYAEWAADQAVRGIRPPIRVLARRPVEGLKESDPCVTVRGR